MKKIADFLVEKRILMLIIMLGLTVLSACMIPHVSVNDDMTKYLSDDSNMKQGIDKMDEEFPDLENTNEIRVMFTGLADSEKNETASRLENIEYVDSVSYDKDDDSYNRGDYTLYCINTEYDFDSEEETAILDSIDEEFSDCTFVTEETNNTHTDLPFIIILAAVTILMIILFAMSGSWIEPILFMAVIGCAVILNLGTNIFKGTVSETTFSIAAILQLVLSMDYSIILMNRYRQELPQAENPVEAMKCTLKNAFMSVTSSATTTFVGLLMLVFMSYKIGPDLGIVLAKGVLFSLLCVFTILPCLILIFNRAIEKTAKPVLPIPTGRLAKFSYRRRIPLTLLFVVILSGTYFLQTLTGISFASTEKSKIDPIFPAENSIVVLYNNSDEEKIASISDTVEDDKKVSSVYSYPTTLGKECTAEEMLDMTEDMNSDMDIEQYMLKLIYYRCYKGDNLPKIKVADLLNFIADDVVENDSFSEYMDSDIKDNISKIRKFADRDTLTKKMSVSELADFFDMDEDELKQMFVLYYKDRSDAGTERMTLSEFVRFLKKDILSDKTYAGMIDGDMADKIDTFETFTNAEKISTPMGYRKAAGILGIDASQLKLLYMYYYSKKDSHVPSAMTLPEFVSFLQKSVLKDPAFSGLIDKSSAAKISQMAAYTDTDAIQKQLSAAGMASFLGVDKSLVTIVYQMYYDGQQVETTDMTMSPYRFISFVLTSEKISPFLDASTRASLSSLKQLMDLTLSGRAISYTDMAEIFGMDVSSMKMLYTLHDSPKKISSQKLTLQQIVGFIIKNKKQFASSLGKNASKLTLLQKVMKGTLSGTSYSYNDMAKLLGTKASDMKQLYLLHQSRYGDTSGWGMSPKEFIDFIQNTILTDDAYRSAFDEDQIKEINSAAKLIDAVISDKPYSVSQAYSLLSSLTDSMSKNDLVLLYTYYGSIYDYDDSWTMSIHGLFQYLNNVLFEDPAFTGLIDKDMKNDVRNIQDDLDEAVDSMKGSGYSILSISTTYDAESDETFAFLKKLHKTCDEGLSHDHYIIGSSAMYYEMSQDFRSEMLLMTLLTAISIFIIVMISFRNVIIPALLVLLVQTAVFATVSSSFLRGYDINYLAYLIVQCILMGATIDYAILITGNYREYRKFLDIKESLAGAYASSMHTILTSGLIMILVTGILGFAVSDPNIGPICQTISIGAAAAVILITFILPAMLAVFDRFIVRKDRSSKSSSDINPQ